MDTELIDRRDLITGLVRRAGNAAIISGLGSPTYDVFAAQDRDENFHLWGAMGGAAMVGLGVAIAQPDRRVIVVTGDGEALMGVGGFAVIAAEAPPNLAILVLDNETFCETGKQTGLTAKGADLALIAKGAGIATTLAVDKASDCESLLETVLHNPGPVVAVAKIRPSQYKLSLPAREGAFLHHRFRAAMCAERLGTDPF